MVTLDILDNRAIVKFRFDAYFDDHLRTVKDIGAGRFMDLPNVGKCWRFPIYKLTKLLAAFPDAWHEKGVAEYVEFCKASEARRAAKDAPQPIGIDLPLWEHQRRALGFVAGMPRSILNAGVGTGKTFCSIPWALGRMETDGRRGCLVVTKSVGKYKYRSEILRAVKGARVAVVEGTRGYFPDADDASWVILNWDILAPRLEQIKARRFSAVIFSEAHKAKAATKSQRGVAAIALSKEIPNVHMETASLIPNRNAEAFAPCMMLGLVDEDDYFPFHIHFAGSTKRLADGTVVNLPATKKLVNRRRNRYAWDFSGSSNSDELHAMLKPFMFRISKEEALPDLPPVSFSPMLVDISNADDYDAAANDFLDWVRETKGEEAAVKAGRAKVLVQMGALFRLSAVGMASQAVDLLESYTEAHEKCVVFCSYKEPLHALRKAYPECSVMITGDENAKQKDAAIEKFQANPSTLLALCSTEAAGESATLTSAAAALFLGVPWSPEAFSQAYGRIHRAGQTRHCEVIVLLGRQTIDIDKVETIYGKALDISRVVSGSDRSTDSEALRKILVEVHGAEKAPQNSLFEVGER